MKNSGTVTCNFYEDSDIEQVGQEDKKLRQRKRNVLIDNLGKKVNVNYIIRKGTHPTYTNPGTVKMIGVDEVLLEVNCKEIRIKLDNINTITLH